MPMSGYENMGIKPVEEIHRRAKVVVKSAPCGGGRWSTEVHVWTAHGDTATQHNVPLPPNDWSAESKAEADEYGLTLGRRWITNHA